MNINKFIDNIKQWNRINKCTKFKLILVVVFIPFSFFLPLAIIILLSYRGSVRKNDISYATPYTND